MVLSNEDNSTVHGKTRNQNGSEQDQAEQFYFLDNKDKLRKTHALPKRVEHFVWESRKTLESDEFLFTLAYSHSFEDYETLVTNKHDIKEFEREEIARRLLGLSIPDSACGVTVLDSDGKPQQIGMNKSAIDSILRDICKSILTTNKVISESIVLDCGFSGAFLLHCKGSKEMPAFKLIWQNDAYHVYAKERGDVQEIKLGTIRTPQCAIRFCELYERMLLLNAKKE
jgi:hypothetical protein